MRTYKDMVDQYGLFSSDRKRMLSLPIYLFKRTQDPQPLRGQKEFDLFANLTGKSYTSDSLTMLDKEEKITEFEFEKFLNPTLLKRINIHQDVFRDFVRLTNFQTNT
jgi:hypothetical protein